MGSRNHFRQPCPSVGPVRVLRAKAPRGDEKLARARDPAPGDTLKTLVHVRVESEPEQVDAELDRGRNLVDVLPSGSGGGEKTFAERVLRKLDVLRPHRANRQMCLAAALTRRSPACLHAE